MKKEVNNYRIYVKRRLPENRRLSRENGRIVSDIPFKGTFLQMKAKVEKILSKQEGVGWTVVSMTDNQVIYCQYNESK